MLAVFGGFSLMGCDSIHSDWIVDWSGVNAIIYVYDKEGNNIVEPEMPGLTLTYMGETYEVTANPFNNMYGEGSRAYMPMMYGLYYQSGKDYSDLPDAPARLIFGEMEGGQTMDEDLVLSWPDGTTNTIHYHCGKHNERKLTRKVTWKLDGEKHEGSQFTFIK